MPRFRHGHEHVTVVLGPYGGPKPCSAFVGLRSPAKAHVFPADHGISVTDAHILRRCTVLVTALPDARDRCVLTAPVLACGVGVWSGSISG